MDNTKMKAIVLTGPTSAEDLTFSEIDIPSAKPGWVVVKIRGFGLNHSEQILRQFDIDNDYIQKPIVPGIECVGEIAEVAPTDELLFSVGQKVVALMGGMGRSFNGSYAEYALLPTNHVFTIKSNLSWKELAAIPETYFTAWGSLFDCLQLKSTDTLLIRGATCTLGYACLQIAKSLGAYCIATTHKEEKLSWLDDADEAIIDDGILEGKIHGVTKALDLVGCLNLIDTLCTVEKGAIVCNTGILGGVTALNNFDPVKDIPNGVYLTGFFSNYPDRQTISEIFSFIDEKNISPKIGACYDFDNIRQASIALDTGDVNGKIVVTV